MGKHPSFGGLLNLMSDFDEDIYLNPPLTQRPIKQRF